MVEKNHIRLLWIVIFGLLIVNTLQIKKQSELNSLLVESHNLTWEIMQKITYLHKLKSTPKSIEHPEYNKYIRELTKGLK